MWTEKYHFPSVPVNIVSEFLLRLDELVNLLDA